MTTDEGSNLRGRVCSLLKKARPPPSNLHKDNRAALKTLKQDKNIIILRAEKGNATIVMNSTESKEEVMSQLENPIYKRVERESTSATERRY